MTNDEIRAAVKRLKSMTVGNFSAYDLMCRFMGGNGYADYDAYCCEYRDTLVEVLERLDTSKWSDEYLEEVGLIRLPVDANGEVIHAGDVLTDDEGNCITVYQITYLEDGVLGYDEYGNEIDIAGCTLYREPTIEDVLDELEDMDSIGDRDAIVMRCRELAGILSELIDND